MEQSGTRICPVPIPDQEQRLNESDHDHALGMTRLNVLRTCMLLLVAAAPDGALALSTAYNAFSCCLAPHPKRGKLFPSFMRNHREIPIAIHDRSFPTDGCCSTPIRAHIR